jgi:hypothetical protein
MLPSTLMRVRTIEICHSMMIEATGGRISILQDWPMVKIKLILLHQGWLISPSLQIVT